MSSLSQFLSSWRVNMRAPIGVGPAGSIDNLSTVDRVHKLSGSHSSMGRHSTLKTSEGGAACSQPEILGARVSRGAYDTLSIFGDGGSLRSSAGVSGDVPSSPACPSILIFPIATGSSAHIPCVSPTVSWNEPRTLPRACGPELRTAPTHTGFPESSVDGTQTIKRAVVWL